MSQIALEKRMNEIRRLEGVKDNLLAALESIAEHGHKEEREIARDAVNVAHASGPAG